MTRNTLNHCSLCVSFPAIFATEKVKQKMLAQSLKLNYWSPRHLREAVWTAFGKDLDSCFEGFGQLFHKLGFLSNVFSFSQLVKIPNKLTQFERKLRNFTGVLN